MGKGLAHNLSFGSDEMPRLRAAGYKYAALPELVGKKSEEELEREQLEQSWKQKTADLWANAEMEVGPAHRNVRSSLLQPLTTPRARCCSASLEVCHCTHTGRL